MPSACLPVGAKLSLYWPPRCLRHQILAQIDTSHVGIASETAKLLHNPVWWIADLIRFFILNTRPASLCFDISQLTSHYCNEQSSACWIRMLQNFPKKVVNFQTKSCQFLRRVFPSLVIKASCYKASCYQGELLQGELLSRRVVTRRVVIKASCHKASLNKASCYKAS